MNMLALRQIPRLLARPNAGTISRPYASILGSPVALQQRVIRRPSPGQHIRHSSTSDPIALAFPNSVPSKTSAIIFSANQPSDLPDRVSKLSRWTVTSSRMGLTRTFTFPTFAAAWRFMSLVADECKAKRHHPSWHNLYNEVTVEWTTHKPLGLSVKDAEMAEFCDRMAGEVGLKKGV